ncbi:methyltransf_12 domain-containing protein, partial [Haematococcus lacustris]
MITKQPAADDLLAASPSSSDRHYFDREFPELCSGPATVVEVGCGAGNTVFPLLELNPGLRV